MQSLSELFQHPSMQGIKRIAVFRCTRDAESHKRNIMWLRRGWTAWWPIAAHREFDGIAVLLDTRDEKCVEVWVGRTLPNSGRLIRWKGDGNWKLGVEGPFERIGVIEAGTMTAVMGKQLGTMVTYFDRPASAPNDKGQLFGPPTDPMPRGYSPEFSGERDVVTPGRYSAVSFHGKVVDGLASWLRAQSFFDLDNRTDNWDMHARASNGTSHLFEVKTDATTTSVHTAIGQLLVYETRAGSSRKILVLPVAGGLAEGWRAIVNSIGLEIMTYAAEPDGAITFA